MNIPSINSQGKYIILPKKEWIVFSDLLKDLASAILVSYESC